MKYDSEYYQKQRQLRLFIDGRICCNCGRKAILTTLDDYIARKDDAIMPFDSEVSVI